MRLAVKTLKLLGVPFVFLLRWVSYIVPRDKHIVAIGSWLGDLYSDSSKYLAEYLLANSDFKVYWVGKDMVGPLLPKHKNMHFVRKDSLRSFFVLLRSKTWVSCQGSWADLTALPIYGGAIKINLWHGIPLKLIGRLAPKNINRKGGFYEIARDWMDYIINGYSSEWVSISSQRAGEIMVGGEPEHYATNRLLPFGLVRNDFLINNRENKDFIKSLRCKYANLFGYDLDKKVILYLPTFRKPGCRVFSFYRLPDEDQLRIKRLLDNENAVLIEKHHYITYRDYPIDRPSRCSIVVPADLQARIDVQELYLATDIMIGDYSSGIIDYGLLKRPAIHYVYDLEEYSTTDSGLAYDLNDVAVGPFVKSLEELESSLEEALRNPSFNPAPMYHELVAYEKGEAGARILEFMKEKLCLST